MSLPRDLRMSTRNKSPTKKKPQREKFTSSSMSLKYTPKTDKLNIELKTFSPSKHEITEAAFITPEILLEIVNTDEFIDKVMHNSLGDNYTVEEHKRITTVELRERGYNQEVIDEWVVYIE